MDEEFLDLPLFMVKAAVPLMQNGTLAWLSDAC